MKLATTMKRLQHGLVAGLFVAVYGLSVAAPFIHVNTARAADPVPAPNAAVKQCTTWATNHSTNLNQNGWTLDAGTQYVDGGMQFTVPGSWNARYISRALTGMTLSDIGTGVDFTATNTPYVGLHVETTDGRFLAFEKEPSYGGKWWSTSDFGVASGMGYATFDTLENIAAANPSVQLKTLYVLYTNPAAATTTVSQVKLGCVTYTFDHEAKVLGDVTTTPNNPTPTPVTPPALEDTGTSLLLPTGLSTVVLGLTLVIALQNSRLLSRLQRAFARPFVVVS